MLSITSPMPSQSFASFRGLEGGFRTLRTFFTTCWRAAGCPFMPVRPPAGPDAHARGGPEVSTYRAYRAYRARAPRASKTHLVASASHPSYSALVAPCDASGKHAHRIRVRPVPPGARAGSRVLSSLGCDAPSSHHTSARPSDEGDRIARATGRRSGGARAHVRRRRREAGGKSP